MIDTTRLPRPHKRFVERSLYCRNNFDVDFIPETITVFARPNMGPYGMSHPHGHETGGPVIVVRSDDIELLDPTLDYLGRKLPKHKRDGFPQWFGAVVLHEFFHLIDEFDPEIGSKMRAIHPDDHVWIPFCLKAYTSIWVPSKEAPAERVAQVREILG